MSFKERFFSYQQIYYTTDPNGERCWRNTSDSEMLCYVVIQSRLNSYTGHTIEDGCGVEKPVSWVGKEKL